MVSAYFLTLLSILTIAPGCIHEFAPDGGAGTIAGLNLAQNGRLVIALFAWAGATQIAFGLAMLVVSLRYRTLAPLMLGLALVELTLHVLNAWLLNSVPGGHRPPEHYGVLVTLPLLLAALALSLRTSERPAQSGALPDRGIRRQVQ